jgi:large subunit ribosomal protein L4
MFMFFVKPDQPVMTTVYSFPVMEPLRFAPYPAQHLRLPLRRDILHRAVVYEGDKTRQGTASTKWRDEVHGSGRKLRPQKGTGSARLRDRGNPMLRGGGVAFGPKPRDFSTDLPRKVYDLAWRTALSYRYSKGELIVVDYDNHNNPSGFFNSSGGGDGGSGSFGGSGGGRFAVTDIEDDHPGYVRQLFETHGWGKPHGRSLVVTYAHRPNLFRALGAAGEVGRALVRDEVDVKDLLELGRIIIEKRALDRILWDHQSDIARKIPTAVGP